MEAVQKKPVKKEVLVRAKFKSYDQLNRFKNEETYLTNVEEKEDGEIKVTLPTNNKSITYKNQKEYYQNWEVIEDIKQEKDKQYTLTVFYKDGVAVASTQNNGVSESDIIAILEATKFQILTKLVRATK